MFECIGVDFGLETLRFFSVGVKSKQNRKKKDSFEKCSCKKLKKLQEN